MSNRTGTVVALTSSLLFNGRNLNGVEFGILANVLGTAFATKTGTAPRPDGQRGKPAVIWELSANSPVVVTELSAVADATVDEADEVVSQNDESANGIDDTEL